MGKEPLYLKDCYLKEWKTKVESVKDGKFVVLEETSFYPQAGGQPWDEGTIKRSSDGKEFKVVFVGKFGGNISHETDPPGLAEGDDVECSLDWERRYRHMRMHTAAHVLSKVIYDETKATITGNQLGTEKSRIDFALEEFDREKVSGWLDKSNEIIEKGLEVKVDFLDREEAMKIPDFVRQEDLIQKIDVLRVIEIGDFDIQPCGGTHLKNIREIGKLKLLKIDNKGKSNRRVYFTLEER